MNDLRKDIEIAINAHSAENGSDTPDFILAKYLTASLAAFDEAVNSRSQWYGVHSFDLNVKDKVVTDEKSDIPEPKREYVAAYTEVGTLSYPAFVSINREKDGLYSITVRTRGHDGNQMATIDKMSRNAIRSLAWDILKGDETLFQKLVQK